MAWNEPGNNGDKNDPWKNRGNKEQGPPDLDKIFQDLSDRIGSIFGGKKRPGGPETSGSSGSGGTIGISIVLAILVLVWVFSGMYTIKEAERAIVLRFGEFYELKTSGLRWNPTFIDTIELVDVQKIESLLSTGSMLTQDENVVSVEFELQYRIIDPRAYKFNVVSPDDSLSQATDSALRHVIGHSLMNDILTSGREKVRQDTWVNIQQIIDPYKLGIEIVDVNFKDARPPDEVKAAFDDAIAAQEDEERFIKEAEAYAREIEPRARGQVKRIEQEANAYQERVILEAKGRVARFEQLLPEYRTAPEVTRQRLYLETMESVYSSTSKVFVDVDSGNNMMYLPLDKLMENHGLNKKAETSRDVVQSLKDQGLNSTNSEPGRSGLRSESRNDQNRSGRK